MNQAQAAQGIQGLVTGKFSCKRMSLESRCICIIALAAACAAHHIKLCRAQGAQV